MDLTLPPRPEGRTLQDWLSSEIRGAVLSGRLPRGSALPASRDLAAQYEMARGTVVSVYEQLCAEGYLVARVGSGTRVSEHLPEDSLPLPEKVRARRAPPSRPEQGRRLFRADLPEISHFPFKVWSKLQARFSETARPDVHADADIAGSFRLRVAVAEYLSVARGVVADPEQIVIVSGVQQAMDTVARVVAGRGADIVVEDPAYFGAVSAFARCGARVVPIPVDDEGLVVAEGERRAPGARLVYVTPGHQFATAVSLSASRRLRLLAWAESAGGYVVEDDYDSEFRFSGRPIPALKGLDSKDRVIHLGTFNKSTFPTLRLGYMVLPDALLGDVLQFRRDVDRPPPGIAQAVLAEFIAEGHFSRHLRRTRQLYAARLSALRGAVDRHLGGVLRVPEIEAGLCTPGYFEEGLTSREGERRARAGGLRLYGLHRFCLERTDLHGLMLGFASMDEAEIEEGVRALAETLLPHRSGARDRGRREG